jgi:hypothetical protein
MARADHVRLLAGLTASPRLGKQSLGFAVLSAMISSVLFGEPFLLRFGTVFLGYFPLFLDYHIAALRHAEGLLEQPEMIKFRSWRMFKRFKP